MTLLGHHNKNAEQQQEVREARRLLKERIRNDWSYPALPAYEPPYPQHQQPAQDAVGVQEDEDTVAGFKFHTPSRQPDQTSLGFEPVEWRERECSSESGESEAECSDVRERLTATGLSVKPSYRFDTPDTVGAQISDQRQARKRKRQEALQAEMGWNEGLAHWVTRRDAWCGARTAVQVQLSERARASQQQDVTSTATSASVASTPRSSTSTSTSSISTSNLSSPNPNTISSASTTPDPTLQSSPSTPSHSQPQTNPSLPIYVPLTPPILPNHPIRRRMTSTTYSEIYNKIITQSRTPSVPINLRTLIAAMVQGWKDDGEWPPKPSGPLEPSIAGKRKKADAGSGGLKSGVKAVGRVLRLTGT